MNIVLTAAFVVSFVALPATAWIVALMGTYQRKSLIVMIATLLPVMFLVSVVHILMYAEHPQMWRSMLPIAFYFFPGGILNVIGVMFAVFYAKDHLRPD